MNLFKIVTVQDKVYIKMLVYNSRVWCERQWAYYYVVENSYPSDYEQHATDFKTIEAAQVWIDDRI
jgi:hypothetical protein